VAIICEPDQPYAGLLAAEIGGTARIVTSLLAVELALTARDPETVVVIGPGPDLEAVLAFATRLRVSRPAIHVVLVRNDLSPHTTSLALTAGVREVVASGNATAVVDAVRRADLSEPADSAGQIVTVFSAKGGCGKTTLATNLAAVLYDGGARRVCLVDLDLTFGDVASTLAMQPVRSLVDALSWQGRLDTSRVPSLVTAFQPGLDCILAPAGPGDGAKVPASLVGELLAVLPASYEYVVVDAPAQFSAHVLTALDSSHHQVLLTTPERPALKNLRLTLDMFDLLSYPRAARAIVVNRSDSRVGLTAAEVEDLVRSPIAGHLPSRRDVPASINRGVPLAMAEPDHVVSQAVRRLAAEHLSPVRRPAGNQPGPSPTAGGKRPR
jgi:MinD-like ATPase involved in chromosome partitioning or flagellar assembly